MVALVQINQEGERSKSQQLSLLQPVSQVYYQVIVDLLRMRSRLEWVFLRLLALVNPSKPVVRYGPTLKDVQTMLRAASTHLQIREYICHLDDLTTELFIGFLDLPCVPVAQSVKVLESSFPSLDIPSAT